MIKIRNRLDQPLLIHRGKASPLHLLAHASAVLEDEEAKTLQVQTLVAAEVLELRSFTGEPVTVAAAPPRERKAAGDTPRRRDESVGMTEGATKKVEG